MFFGKLLPRDTNFFILFLYPCPIFINICCIDHAKIFFYPIIINQEIINNTPILMKKCRILNFTKSKRSNIIT